MTKRRAWSEEEKRVVRSLYADVPTKHIATILGRSLTTVYQTAQKMGLKKSADYQASPHACRLRRGDNIGAEFRFQKGIVPFNKGMRRPGYAPGRMAKTQFKPGTRPPNYKPLGSTRLKDGYLQVKVTDTGYPPRDWVSVHVMNWVAAHGPIPKGHALVFKDGDKTNTALENLELLSRRDLMRRNSIHNLPKELFEVIQLNGALKRKLRRLDEKQNVGSTQSPVRDSRSA